MNLKDTLKSEVIWCIIGLKWYNDFLPDERSIMSLNIMFCVVWGLMAVNVNLVAMLSHPFTRHHSFFPSLLYLSSTLQQQLHITEVKDMILRHLDADWDTRVVFDQRWHHPTSCLWAANYNRHLSKTWTSVVLRQKAWLGQHERGPWRTITM